MKKSLHLFVFPTGALPPITNSIRNFCLPSLGLDPMDTEPDLKTSAHSPGKWLHNWISYPSNRSKQMQETHTTYYSASTKYTRQSLNKKQHT